MSTVLAKPTTTGTLTGAIDIPGSNSDQFVTLSFRQAKKCQDAVDPTVTNQSYAEAKMALSRFPFSFCNQGVLLRE